MYVLLYNKHTNYKELEHAENVMGILNYSNMIDFIYFSLFMILKSCSSLRSVAIHP